jgi:hypothetical protein
MVNDLPTVEITLLDGIRNRTSLLVITWVFILNVIETFLPVFVTIVFVKVLYVLQLFLSLVAIEILLHDITLTSMACVVLVACDAFLVLYTSVYHIYHEIRVQKWPNAQSGATNDASAENENVATTMPHTRSKTSLRDDMSDEFDVNHNKINIDSLNWRIFQKKSN